MYKKLEREPTLLVQVVTVGDAEFACCVLLSVVALPASTEVVLGMLEGASHPSSTYLWTYYPHIYLVLCEPVDAICS